MKKILIGTGIFAFAFVLTAGLAFASHHKHNRYQFQENYAHNVSNYIEASSFTGNNNMKELKLRGSFLIDTGDATSSAEGTNAINSNRNEMIRMNNQKNMAENVTNGIGSYSETGSNDIYDNVGKRRGGGSATINTGNASSSASGMNLINTNVKMGGSWVQ